MKTLILFFIFLLSLILTIVIYPVFKIAKWITRSKFLIILFMLFIFSCEKQPTVYCYDCTIKQSNGIEYAAKYWCTEDQLTSIIESNKIYGTIITCKK